MSRSVQHFPDLSTASPFNLCLKMANMRFVDRVGKEYICQTSTSLSLQVKEES